MPTSYSLKSKDGIIQDNLSGQEIKNLAQAGKINPDDMISKTNSNQWIAAYRVKGIQLTNPKKRTFRNDTNFPQKIQIEDSKICPYCAEKIKKDSKICRFCRIDFATGKSIDTVATAPQKDQKEIGRGEVKCPFCQAIIKPQSKQANGNYILITMILLCFFIVPGVIYMIWESSRKQCPECKMTLS